MRTAVEEVLCRVAAGAEAKLVSPIKDGVASGDDFDTYFADSVLDDAGVTPISQGYAFAASKDSDFDTGKDV